MKKVKITRSDPGGWENSGTILKKVFGRFALSICVSLQSFENY